MREERERRIQAAQQRLTDALAILEAWEQVWAHYPRPQFWAVEEEKGHPWRYSLEYRLAVAHLIALVRASAEPYVFARGQLFNHIGADTEYERTFFDREHDLGEAGRYAAFDPESEDNDRLIIRTEVLEAAEKARKALALAGQTTRTQKE